VDAPFIDLLNIKDGFEPVPGTSIRIAKKIWGL